MNKEVCMNKENEIVHDEGMSVSEVLFRVYENLKNIHEAYGIVFSPVAVSNVFSSVSFPEMTATLEYEEGSILRIKNSFWVLMYGKKGGNDPNNFVASDLSLFSICAEDIELGHELLSEKISLIMRRDGNYFGFSLFYGSVIGNIQLSPRNNMFREALFRKMGTGIKDFVLSNTEYEMGGKIADIRTRGPIVTKQMMWKPETVQFLSSLIEETIIEFS